MSAGGGANSERRDRWDQHQQTVHDYSSFLYVGRHCGLKSFQPRCSACECVGSNTRATGDVGWQGCCRVPRGTWLLKIGRVLSLRSAQPPVRRHVDRGVQGPCESRSEGHHLATRNQRKDLRKKGPTASDTHPPFVHSTTVSTRSGLPAARTSGRMVPTARATGVAVALAPFPSAFAAGSAATIYLKRVCAGTVAISSRLRIARGTRSLDELAEPRTDVR